MEEKIIKEYNHSFYELTRLTKKIVGETVEAHTKLANVMKGLEETIKKF